METVVLINWDIAARSKSELPEKVLQYLRGDKKEKLNKLIRQGNLSVKFLDAYFGTDGSKIEVAPGDKNVPFTVIMSNVGTQDITGIKGKLSLPAAYQSPSGRGVAIIADNDSKASAGNTFALTFFVDVSSLATIKDYSGTIELSFSRLRESGERNETFPFTFKLTGDSIVNLKPLSGALTSIVNNLVIIEISNAGTAPLNNVDIVLNNDLTSVSSQSKSITNLENVIFDQSNWDVGTIDPQSATSFSFYAFIPESIKNVNDEFLLTLKTRKVILEDVRNLVVKDSSCEKLSNIMLSSPPISSSLTACMDKNEAVRGL